MREITPQYLLATDTRSDIYGGKWEFLLERVDQVSGQKPWKRVESDFEPSVFGDRLALLAVVRGLEALPQPSRILLLTDAVSVHRGFRRKLSHIIREGVSAKRNSFRNLDLWTRVAHAQQFHQIKVRSLKPLRKMLEQDDRTTLPGEVMRALEPVPVADVRETLVA